MNKKPTMKNKMRGTLLAAIFACIAWTAQAEVKVLVGFEPGESKDYMPSWDAEEHEKNFQKPKSNFVKEHVTQGTYALKFVASEDWCPGLTWPLIEKHSKENGTTLTGQPPQGSYHKISDWYYQRYGGIWDDALHRRTLSSQDWSKYEVMRFDVFSTKAEFVLGVKILDCGKERIPAAPQGLRTNAIIFKIPPGNEQTCEISLSQIATVCEMDLSNIQGFVLRVNGYGGGDTDLFIDNIRLVSKDSMAADAKFPLLEPEGGIIPFARKVVYFEPPKIDEAKIKRTEGKVEKLGPVTVFSGKGIYACGCGHFGGSGVTYYQNTVRGVVVYDDNRFLLIFRGTVPPGARKTNNFMSETDGCLGTASFDGGKTWGGVMEGEALPTNFFDWFWRGSMSADTSGDLYFSGTQNCTSYHEHYDVFFRRLKFVGNGWVEDRFSMMDQNMQKCPMFSRSLKLKNGRIWSAWNDGWEGILARFSDDDGYTWEPCKDASATKVPRPFYEPSLELLKKPEAQRPKPPKEILIWPATAILKNEEGDRRGGFLMPYKDTVAAVNGVGNWQVYEGTKWGDVKTAPKWTDGEDHLGYASETIVGGSKIFLARASFYDDAGTEKLSELLATHLNEDGTWAPVEKLEDANVADCAMTSSGNNAYCFYSKKNSSGKYELRYRKWKAGTWEPSVLLATEDKRINKIAVPQISRPNFVAVLWDQFAKEGGREVTDIKFIKFPNE